MLLPGPPDSFVDDLQKACFQFVCNGRQDTIASKPTIKDVKNYRGLNVPDIKIYVLPLKLTWLQKIKTANHQWKK